MVADQRIPAQDGGCAGILCGGAPPWYDSHMIEWIWTLPVAESTDRFMLVILEHLGAESRWVEVSTSAMADALLVPVERVHQSSQRLIAQGALRHRPGSGTSASRWQLPHAPSSDVPVKQAFDPAIEVTRKWWGRTNPKPLIKGGFPAAMRIVRSAIDAGWRPAQVELALDDVPTLTKASLELALNRLPAEPTRPAEAVRVQCDECDSVGWIEGPPPERRWQRCPSIVHQEGLEF